MFSGISTTTIFFALIGGVIPTFLWLWYWLRQDAKHPEPFLMLLLSFLGGALAVVVVIPIQRFAGQFFAEGLAKTMTLAGLEELVKFLIILAIALHQRFLDEPTDYLIYLVTGALGFAALENTLFLISPITDNDLLGSIVTGNLRFLGATVVHAASAAIMGIVIGLAYYRSKTRRLIHVFVGIILAIILHGVFNFFIIQEGQHSVISVLAGLWVVTIFILLLLEKVRGLYPPPHWKRP